MSRMIDRLEQILSICEESLLESRERIQQKGMDKNGSHSMFLAGHLRDVGCSRFVLFNELSVFHNNLRESVEIVKSLFERYENGEDQVRSWCSMLTFHSLYDALAAGEFELATKLAGLMGGRDVEKRIDNDFIQAFGYCLKAFVLQDNSAMQEWSGKLFEVCNESDPDFLGYPAVFNGIKNEDLEMVNAGMESIIDGHKRQSKRGGHFHGSMDEVLCVWGVGMANLGRWRGIEANAIPPLIPKTLLVSVER